MNVCLFWADVVCPCAFWCIENSSNLVQFVPSSAAIFYGQQDSSLDSLFGCFAKAHKFATVYRCVQCAVFADNFNIYFSIFCSHKFFAGYICFILVTYLLNRFKICNRKEEFCRNVYAHEEVFWWRIDQLQIKLLFQSL